MGSRQTRKKAPPRRDRVEPALRELINISNVVGSDPDLVQGGGGNTSVKTRDGKTIYVKASGTSLAEMDATSGWAELDLSAARDIANATDLLKQNSAAREAQVLSLLQASVRRPLGARPSVESSLHALLDRVVIHTHPVHLNTLLCDKRARTDYRKWLPRLQPPPLFLPYTDPGFVLSVRLARELERYIADHGRRPSVVYLENHGLFVAHDDVDACLRLSKQVTGFGRRATRLDRVNAKTFAPLPSTAVRRGSVFHPDLAALRGALRRAGCASALCRIDDSEVARKFVRSEKTISLARRGAFTPDQIVYCRTHPLILRGENPERWERAASLYCERYGIHPRVVILPRQGVCYLASNLPELRVVSEVYRSAMVTLLTAGKNARFLNRRQAGFIEGWEVEAFRAQLPSGGTQRLTGQVAFVTGAASGLGKGIARGLASAGALVIAADVDREALAAASVEIGSSRYLPVVTDVTDEQSVENAFRTIEMAAGGLDVLVNAAGIAPSFPLVDFPVDAWRRTLELNLTGYFLCGRSAARLFLRQNCGGSIINLTSKSGLDASKSNSAYNATKAGEIHLMRGWAMELGGAGIRVNCVAPGNVFKGSKIWNAQYIRSAAKKKGIRPEEVIPYYTSLSPLGQEIEPDDVASAVLYLVSEEGRKVSGQTLVVDGGQVMVR